MNSTNKFLISIIACVLLNACSRGQLDREEPPVEIRRYHTIQSREMPLKTYVVCDGDSVGSIANATGLTRAELIKLNKLTPPYELFPGQELIIGKSDSKNTEDLNKTQPHNFNYATAIQTSNIAIVPEGGLETEYKQHQEKTDLSSQQEQITLNADNNSSPDPKDITSDTNSTVPLGEDNTLVEIEETEIPTTSYVWPVTNGRSRIFKPFDEQSGNILISTPGRTPVKAIADGVVKMAGKSSNEQLVRFGNMIVIQHKTLKKVSIYANVVDLKVKVGQTVSTGDIIASVGQTGIRGMTTNPALYFEIDQITNGKKRQPMDPSNILP